MLYLIAAIALTAATLPTKEPPRMIRLFLSLATVAVVIGLAFVLTPED